MSLVKPNNVLEESWLLFFLTGLCGLRVVGRRNWRWMSYLWSIFVALAYCVAFFLVREPIWRHYESLQDVIYYLQNQKLQGYFNLIVAPGMILANIIKSSDVTNAYKKLDDIDRVLLYLNIQIDHKINMRKEVVRLFAYIFMTVFVNCFTYVSTVTVDAGFIFDISWYLNFLAVFIQVITLCGFDVLVRKILVRFELINRVIGNLLGPRKISVILVQSADINNAAKLRLARRIHLQLHDAASAINNAYGLRLFLIFFVTLISVLNYIRKALNLLENDLQTLDLSLYLIWISFHLGKYFYIASSCRAATKEIHEGTLMPSITIFISMHDISQAKLAGEFFFEASLTRGSDGFNEEAEALSRQLINKELQFNVFAIISTNFSRFLMIFIAVLTYFLLLA